MPEQIRDGKGRGFLTGVNSDNQLLTRATAVEQRLHSAIDSKYYELTTGLITLTDAVETPLVYIKNENTNPNMQIVVDRIFFDTWATTNGSGVGTLEYYRNPTVTGGSVLSSYNCNFSSSLTLTGTFLKSMTTMTGDEWWQTPLAAETSVVLEEGRFVIPAGRSFGIAVIAPAANTSMKININVAVYEFDVTLVS